MLNLAPFILSSAAGLVLVIGCLLLLWKGRIVLDTEGKNVSTIKLPLGIKIATHFPVVILFLLGVVLLVYPIYQAKIICPELSLHGRHFPEMVKVSGKVISQKPVDVFAVVAHQPDAHAVILHVPFKKDTSYQMLYAVDNQVLESVPFDMTNTEPITLQEYEVQPPLQASPSPSSAASPQRVSKAVEAEFKIGGPNQ